LPRWLLSAGYFVYGELFRNKVKHSDFRAIMNYDPSNPNACEGVEARVDDRFSESANEDLQIFRTICRASEPYSIVGFAHSNNRFGAFVGILGDYIGLIHVPAAMECFPKGGEHQMGHMIQLKNQEIICGSMKQSLGSFLKWIEEEKGKNQTNTQP
jgi:hypothetical protein